MDYYILTQGTKSEYDSLILKNGEVIESIDDSRVEIIKKFNDVDSKGVKITNKHSRVNIKKFKKNYLIDVLTINSDKLGRNIVVELLLNHLKTTKLKENLIEINSILKKENILLDESDWLNIPILLENRLKKYNQKKSMTYVIVISIAMILFLIVIIFLKN